MAPSLSGRISLVTGGSRGIGRGIALQLGEAGATVYITGRKAADLQKTCDEVKARGAKEAIAVVMDHAKDDEVEALFERIKKEQGGQLDICVNNAYAGVSAITESIGKKFYETPAVGIWDSINGVGLRNHYLCTVFASRMMVKRKSGLIINVSSPGGLRYLFNVAYGVGKAACDRMAADCAVELKSDGVTMLSLWPGPVATEHVQENVLQGNDEDKKRAFQDAETVEMAGRAIAHLAADREVMRKTGRVLMTFDLAQEYGFTDVDGEIHGDIRCIKKRLIGAGYTTTAMLVPEFIRVPLSLLHYASYKF